MSSGHRCARLACISWRQQSCRCWRRHWHRHWGMTAYHEVLIPITQVPIAEHLVHRVHVRVHGRSSVVWHTSKRKVQHDFWNISCAVMRRASHEGGHSEAHKRAQKEKKCPCWQVEPTYESTPDPAAMTLLITGRQRQKACTRVGIQILTARRADAQRPWPPAPCRRCPRGPVLRPPHAARGPPHPRRCCAHTAPICLVSGGRQGALLRA
jgi:hypothetical protein